MNFERTAEIIDRTVAKHEENGAAFVVTQNGKPVFSHSAGFADIGNRREFREDTICRAFSCTKVATSVSCMKLIENGLIDTADELSWYIPEFAHPFYIENGRKHESAPIRIRDLLNMTSGIPYPGDAREGGSDTSGLWGRLDQSIRDGKSMTTQEYAAEAGKCALMFPAGREWMYGGSADVLGAVIERIADMPLSDFMKKNIFDPLGMEDTAFYVPAEKRDRLAVLYDGAGEDPKLPSYVNLCIYDYDSEPAFKSGGAGLFSTAADYAKLGAALSDGSKLLGSRTIDFMRQNGLTDIQRTTYNWDSTRGFGYANLVRMLEDRNVSGLSASPGAFGWDGWTGTYLLCDPAEKLSLVLFIQRCGAGTSRLSRLLVNAVYASL